MVGWRDDLREWRQGFDSVVLMVLDATGLRPHFERIVAWLNRRLTPKTTKAPDAATRGERGASGAN
jgi:hypothetical protein